MFVLEKVLTPALWEFRSFYIEHIYSQLDANICGSCKLTEAEYRAATEQVDAEYEEGWHNFKPETFSQWGLEEKISWLLGTSCGWEFVLDEED